MATRRGTWAYRDRFGDAYGRTYFRRFGAGVVGSVGTATGSGAPTPAVDDRCRAALVSALESGANLVATAASDRCGRSERVVGEAVREADVDREAVVVGSRAGIVPFDGERPSDPGAYVRERYVEPGLIPRDELARGSHSLAPAFVDATLDRSLAALGLERIDWYGIERPEAQLAVRDREAVYDRLETAFERLERRRTAGDVGRYGLSTWDAFRVGPDHERHLSLPAVLERARAAAVSRGREPDEHGLGVLSLPFGATMADAFTAAVHPTDDGEWLSALAYAERAGLDVLALAPLARGELAAPDALPAAVADELAGETPAQRAINFARSAPAVTAAVVGTSRPAHVAENLAAGTFDPIGARAFDAVFE
jgi:aryl-alcohol dehydrogenase-like predicted oxidoreductase